MGYGGLRARPMAALLLYISVALGFSFLCSLLEAVLLSVTPSYVRSLEDKHPKAGRSLQELKSRVDRPLAAILSLNTIAHTVGAAGAGAEAQALWGSQALAAASVVLTLLILVVSEIIPKTVGALYWRQLGPWAARLLPWMILVLYPLVVLSEGLTRLLSKRGRDREEVISRDELAAMAHLGAEAGVFGESETRILKNLFILGKLRVRDIMTPRTVVFSIQHATPVRDVIARARAVPFSRIPVFGENEDDVLGYVLKDEILLHAAKDELDRPVGDFRRTLLVVPDSLPVATFFERLLDHREHIALVVDEYGGVAGVASMEDVVETLLGTEIVDEADTVQDLRQMARARWFARARRLGIVHEEEGDPESPPP
ncbi:MAG: CNNM domain-containing protein [Myxococcota bacterium]